VTIAPRGAQQEARPYIHKTCMVDKDTTLTYDGYQLYGEDLSVFAAAVCFRQLDLAHFDALIWPTPRSIDRRSVKLVSAAVSD